MHRYAMMLPVVGAMHTPTTAWLCRGAEDGGAQQMLCFGWAFLRVAHPTFE